jgi:hypothetical protein
MGGAKFTAVTPDRPVPVTTSLIGLPLSTHTVGDIPVTEMTSAFACAGESAITVTQAVAARATRLTGKIIG